MPSQRRKRRCPFMAASASARARARPTSAVRSLLRGSDMEPDDLAALRIDAAPLPPPPPRRGRRVLAAVAIAAVTLVAAGRFWHAAAPEAKTVPPVAGAPVAAPAAPAAGLTAAAETFLVGGSVRIAAEVAGRLVELPFDVGARVRRGDVVARLDDTSYRVAEEGARMNLAIARTQASLSRDQYRRSVRLAAEHLISESDFKETGIRAQLDADRVALEETNVAAAAQKRAACRVVAPIDGVVTERLAHVGEYVVAGSAPILTLADVDQLRVQAYVAEADAPRIGPGAGATIELNAMPGTPLRGKVASLDPVVDVARGTVRVEIELVDADPRLRSGMSGRVRFGEAVAGDRPDLAPATPTVAREPAHAG